MLEVLLLSVALAMDAFAVSIALGSRQSHDLKSMALKAGIFFGGFQSLMPLVGFLAGVGLESYIADIDHWVAFGLLGLIGGKMVYESFGSNDEVVCATTNRMLLTLAIATSIDAMAAGFTLNLFILPPLISIIIIGIVTFCFSFAGVYIGAKGGEFLESKAEFIGGVVLIGIGLKILVEHLGLV